ncbi:MAG: peptidase [Gemmatimonadetes bacterium]|nr:peptidase [Gemmatimonadota bacterium]
MSILMLLPVCAALSSACRDSIATEAAGTRVGAARMLGDVTCTVTPREKKIVCEAARSASAGGSGLRAAILGQNQIKMVSQNVQLDTVTRVFQADVTVQNLLAYALGTPDGSTVTGVKVFYFAGPTVTSYVATGDTGTVTVRNADGTGNFTAAGQPFYLYNQTLAPNAVSASKVWQWNWPRTVKTFSFQVKVFAATPVEAAVPATPPDSFPTGALADSIWAAANRVDDSRFGGSVPRNLVVLGFKPGVSSEERQAAVDAVGGRVIGGSRWGQGGIYLIRIGDDGTPEPLYAAIKLLKALPQVNIALADLYVPVGPQYLLPNDGHGFGTRDWTTDPDSAAGDNWGLEAISAPLAWGCVTGASAPAAIGIVDTGQHATDVAAIVAAPGNDGRGITGVMWGGTPSMFNYNPVSTLMSGAQLQSNIQQATIQAAMADARLINVSAGINWLHDFHRKPMTFPAPDSVRRDSARAQAVASYMLQALAAIELAHKTPVITFSAGNDDTDAYFNGYAMLADTLAFPLFRDRVLVVGASNIHGRLWKDAVNAAGATVPAGSNRGSLISLVAPGENIPMSDTLAGNGTSLSAPFVAGIGGLIATFDPRITGDTLRRLILLGARHGGRTADGYPIANAYESLKLAAARRGAPLCGNRVWVENGTVRVLRDSANPGSVENLFTAREGAAAEQVWLLNTLHGGKRILVSSGVTYDARAFDWAAGAWTEEAAHNQSLFPRGSAGSLNSAFGSSHDGDSTVTYQPGGTVTPTVLPVQFVMRDSSYTVRRALRTINIPQDAPASQAVCLHQWVAGQAGPPAAGDSTRISLRNAWFEEVRDSLYTPDPCDSRADYTPHWRSPLVGPTVYSPAGDRILVVANYHSGEGVVSSYDCDKDWVISYMRGLVPDTVMVRTRFACMSISGTNWSSGAKVYSIRTRDGHLDSLPDWGTPRTNISYAAASETGREWIAQYASDSTSFTDPGTTQTLSASCQTRFQNLATGALTFTMSTCESGTGTGIYNSGFAPSRAGSRPPASAWSAASRTMTGPRHARSGGAAGPAPRALRIDALLARPVYLRGRRLDVREAHPASPARVR